MFNVDGGFCVEIYGENELLVCVLCGYFGDFGGLCGWCVFELSGFFLCV